MGEEDGVQHFLFGNFLCTGFDHQDGVLRAGNGQVQAADLELFHRRVDDEFAVHQADAYTGNGSQEGDVGYAQGCGSTNHAGNVRGIVGVYGNSRADNLHIVMVAFGEHGADGTVDEAARQDGMRARTSFAFNETAGNLAYGVHLFFKVDGQGEEIHAFPRGLGTRRGHYHHRIAIAYEQAAVRLFADFTEFEGKRSASQVHCVTVHLFPPITASLQTLCRAQL